jgi:hypothetical protein
MLGCRPPLLGCSRSLAVAPICSTTASKKGEDFDNFNQPHDGIIS